MYRHASASEGALIVTLAAMQCIVHGFTDTFSLKHLTPDDVATPARDLLHEGAASFGDNPAYAVKPKTSANAKEDARLPNMADDTAGDEALRDLSQLDLGETGDFMTRRWPDEEHDAQMGESDRRTEAAPADSTQSLWGSTLEFLMDSQDPEEEPSAVPPPPPPPPPTPAEDDSADDKDDKEKEDDSKTPVSDEVLRNTTNATKPQNLASFNYSSFADPQLRHKSALRNLDKANKDLDAAINDRNNVYKTPPPPTLGESNDVTRNANMEQIQKLHVASLTKLQHAVMLSKAARDHLGNAASKQVAQKLADKKNPASAPSIKMDVNQGRSDKRAHNDDDVVDAQATETALNDHLIKALESDQKYRQKLNWKRAQYIVSNAALNAIKEKQTLKAASDKERKVNADPLIQTVSEIPDPDVEKALQRLHRRNGNVEYVKSLVSRLSSIQIKANKPGGKNNQGGVKAVKEQIQEELNGLKTGHEQKYKSKIVRLEAEKRKTQKDKLRRREERQRQRAEQQSTTSIEQLKAAQVKLKKTAKLMRMPKAAALARSITAASKLNTQATMKRLQISQIQTETGPMKAKLAALKNQAMLPPKDLVEAAKNFLHHHTGHGVAPSDTADQKEQKQEPTQGMEERSARTEKQLVKAEDSLLKKPEMQAIAKTNMNEIEAKTQKDATVVQTDAKEMLRHAIGVEARIEDQEEKRTKDCTHTMLTIQELQANVANNDCLEGEQSKVCAFLSTKLLAQQDHAKESGCFIQHSS